ncbi:heterokaryon incompatibility protein-domain-containing protein [Xylariales sp. PMI_506]|nr:heterokaryon incompatibility protein-domain-containing protein [Xylariales sp. PMI_506]
MRNRRETERIRQMQMWFEVECCQQALDHNYQITIASARSGLPFLETYTYRPLRDARSYLRLLYLHPSGSPASSTYGIIQAELRTYRRHQTPPYIALSYTWGEHVKNKPLVLGNQTTLITPNLYVALEYLRHDQKPLRLWVDDLCINQEDESEKGHQVQMMAEIYNSASAVVAWLGPADEHSSTAFARIDQYAEDATLRIHHGAADPLGYFVPKHARSLPIEPINSLISRAWFQRVWVLQEVRLNEHVFFVSGAVGLHRVYFMAGVMKWFASTRLLSMSRPNPLRFALGTRPMTMKEYTADLIAPEPPYNGLMMRSSEPRDYVFSILNTISDAEKLGLVADYSKSVEEIYTDFAAAFIEAGSIGALAKTWCGHNNYPKLPSWVPDWSATYATPIMYQSMPTGLSWPKGIPAQPPAGVQSAVSGGRFLRVSAALVGRVEHVKCSIDTKFSEPTEVNSQLSKTTDAVVFLEMLDEMLRSQSVHLSEDQIDDCVMRMPLAAGTRDVFENRRAEITLSYYALRGRWVPPENVKNPELWWLNTSRMYLDLWQLSGLQHLFHTSGGVVGIANKDIQLGDCLCVLSGARGQWVVREYVPGNWKLVASGVVFARREDQEAMAGRVQILDIF